MKPLSLLLLCLLYAAPNLQAKDHRRFKRPMQVFNNELSTTVPNITSINNLGGVQAGVRYLRYLKNARYSIDGGVYIALVQDVTSIRWSEEKNKGWRIANAYYGTLGAQWHPFRNITGCNYSIGCAAIFGLLKQTTRSDGAANGVEGTKEQETMGMPGLALTNDVVFNRLGHQNLLLGLHLAIGYTLNGSNLAPYGQFGLRIGRKFNGRR